MRNDWMAEMERKNHFLDCLRETLMVDQKRNELESMEYRYDIETKEEVIILKFRSGREKKGTGNRKQQWSKPYCSCKGGV